MKLNLLFIAWAKILEHERSISSSSLNGSGVDQENKEERGAQDSLLLPQGFDSFPSGLSRAKSRNLVRMEYL